MKLRPHKRRITSAVLYYADGGPFSDPDLIAQLVGCAREDAPVIVMNCPCNNGQSYLPEVVKKATGRTDVQFWRRPNHDMENVMCGQLLQFAETGKFSLVEPVRPKDRK